MSKRSKLTERSGGCFFVFITAVFACMVILVNGLILSGFYEPIESFAKNLVGFDSAFQRRESQERFVHFITRSVMYLGPVLLLVVQWWLLDLVLDVTSGKSEKEPSALSK